MGNLNPTVNNLLYYNEMLNFFLKNQMGPTNIHQCDVVCMAQSTISVTGLKFGPELLRLLVQRLHPTQVIFTLRLRLFFSLNAE